MHPFKPIEGKFDPMSQVFQMFEKHEEKKAMRLHEYLEWCSGSTIIVKKIEGMFCLLAEKQLHSRFQGISIDFISSYDHVIDIKSGDVVKIVCCSRNRIGNIACRQKNLCQYSVPNDNGSAFGPCPIFRHDEITTGKPDKILLCQDTVTFLSFDKLDPTSPYYNCKVLTAIGVINVPLFQVSKI